MLRRLWPALAGTILVGLVAMLVATGIRDALAGPPKAADRLSVCPGEPGVAPGPGAGGSADVAPVWWRSVSVLDADGSIVGRSLTVGRGGAELAHLALPTESSVSGPVGGLVVVASDDGAASLVRLLAVGRGCAWTIPAPEGVLRRAVLSPDGTTLLAHVVERASRVDLGVWARPLVGGGSWARVLAPLDGVAAGTGRVWATDVRATADGRLVVQSCGDTGCVVRVTSLDGTRPVTLSGGRMQGHLLGVAGDRLIVWQECGGAPCPILAWPIGARSGTRLADDAVAAELSADGTRLVILRIDPAGSHLLAIDPASGARWALADAGGLRPLAIGLEAFAGIELPADAVAIGSSDALPRILITAPAGTEVLP